MVDGLLDSSVVIDLIRKHPPAQQWLTQQQSVLGVSALVWLEILEGAQNKRDQRLALRVLKRFVRVSLESTDLDWAIQQAAKLVLSHRVDAMDCLIASINHRLQVPLYTRNLKHFTPLLGALALSPY